jgi:hypothetical protein
MALYDHVMHTEKKKQMWNRNKHQNDIIRPYSNDQIIHDVEQPKNKYGVAYYLWLLLVLVILIFIGYWAMYKMKNRTKMYSSYESSSPNFGPDVNVRPMFRNY